MMGRVMGLRGAIVQGIEDNLAYRRTGDPRRLARELARRYEDLNQLRLPDLYRRARRARAAGTPHQFGWTLATAAQDVRTARRLPYELRVPRIGWEIRA